MTEPLSAATEELDCIAMLPVYLPPQMEDEDDRYLLRGAVLALVDSAKRQLDAARTLDVEKIAADVRGSIQHDGSEYRRGFDRGIDKMVARLTAKDAEP